MDTKKCRLEFKNFQILLGSGCSPTIAIGRVIKTINPKENDVMQWHTKKSSINTQLKVKTGKK